MCCMDNDISTHTYKHKHTYTYTHIHAYTYTHTYTYIHAHTHMQHYPNVSGNQNMVECDLKCFCMNL